MPMPKVTTSVVDLSTRVTSTGTYNSAIVVAAKKGPVDTPVLVTSQTDFLEQFAPNEVLEIGWDNALYEAYIYLGLQSNLYVVRAANTTSKDAPALYGGCHIRTFKSSKAHAPIDKGFIALEEHVYNGEGGIPDVATKHYDTPDDVIDLEEDALLIYGSSQGKWNNDIAVSIVTDPEQVKLDGAFIINVYKDKALVDTHTVSLDPNLKNGFGNTCYVETVLKASKYIRADVSDNLDAIMASSYPVRVVGKAKFTNAVCDYIDQIKKATGNKTFDSYKITRAQDYNEGEIRWVNDVNGGIENAYGYYKCTQAGRTGASIPTFTAKGSYKPEVIDGEVVWALQEIVKPYASDTDFNAGEIASVEQGTNTLYYRALLSGTTGTEAPKFAEDAYEVKDGTIVWEAQKQALETFNEIGYTYLEKKEGAALDLKNYKVYSDIYLVTEQQREETVTLDNPLRYVDWSTGNVKIKSEKVTPEYTAIYEGEASEEHYCLPKATTANVSLNGGADGAEPTNVEYIRALKTLKNLNDVNVQLIMDGGNTTPAYQRAIDEVCEFREMSTKGIISTPYINELGMVTGDAQKDVVNYRKSQLNANTRNLALYTPHQLVYDEFNDRNIYVSPSCFVAARLMGVAQEYGWHWAAAGYSRGVLNSLDVAKSYDPTIVDTFSDAQINTIIKEPGSGQVIFDELDLQSKASDLQDFHNSCYLDIYLRPRIKDALKQYLFEFNDETTRNLMVKMLTTFLDPEVSARALYDYQIVCDETNNRPKDIQNNTCNVWIFVQLMKLCKYIPVKFIVSPYSVDFDDLGYTG